MQGMAAGTQTGYVSYSLLLKNVELNGYTTAGLTYFLIFNMVCYDNVCANEVFHQSLVNGSQQVSLSTAKNWCQIKKHKMVLIFYLVEVKNLDSNVYEKFLILVM